MKRFFRDFFKNPALPTITAILTVIGVIFVNSPTKADINKEKVESARLAVVRANTAPKKSRPQNTLAETSGTTAYPTNESPVNETEYVTNGSGIIVTASPADAVSTSSGDTTSSQDTSTETTTTATPHEYNYDYTPAGDSPNSSYYQDRLTIVGDSIAYGFNAYGYIPYEHNLAQESLALWNMDSYYFDTAYGTYGLIDAADYINSPLYFVSIGMNDIYGYTADQYGQEMLNLAQQILERVPTATIVVGSITPVSEYNYYTTNDVIQEFNYSLQSYITSANSSQILFFDTNRVLIDPNTNALSYDYSGGDGLHIAGYSYQHILNYLFNFLDSTNAMEQIKVHDTTAY